MVSVVPCFWLLEGFCQSSSLCYVAAPKYSPSSSGCLRFKMIRLTKSFHLHLGYCNHLEQVLLRNVYHTQPMSLRACRTRWALLPHRSNALWDFTYEAHLVIGSLENLLIILQAVAQVEFRFISFKQRIRQEVTVSFYHNGPTLTCDIFCFSLFLKDAIVSSSSITALRLHHR